MSSVALTAEVVQKTVHFVQGADEGELERKQLDRKLESQFCGMSADLLRGVHHQLPLPFRRQQAMLEHVLARNKSRGSGPKGTRTDCAPLLSAIPATPQKARRRALAKAGIVTDDRCI
jgi:hypothetical protein